MTLSRSLLAICVATLAAVGGKSAALSADFGAAPEQVVPASQWKLSFTPYGWLTWLHGEQTVRGRSVDVHVDPIQVLDHLERVPFFGYGEARNGPLALYSDIFYANLGLSGGGIRSRSLASGITGTLSGSLGLDFEEAVVEVGGAYEVMKCDRHTAIDVLAGARRYWHQEMSINLALAGSLDAGGLDISRGFAIDRSGSVDWVDPRWRLLREKLTTTSLLAHLGIRRMSDLTVAIRGSATTYGRAESTAFDPKQHHNKD